MMSSTSDPSYGVDPCTVAIVDSGIGGLSFIPHIRAAFPQHNIVYLADTLYLPYGDKDPAFVTERCQQIVHYLVEHYPISLCVLACNTATALAIDVLRSSYTIPLVGVEPAIKSAVLLTKIGKIGVLATHNTIHSHRYRLLIQKYAGTCQVISQSCPGLVEYIESQEDPIGIEAYLNQFLFAVKAEKIDVLVLGCTHYSFFKKRISAQFDHPTILIDTIMPVILQMKNQLTRIDQPWSHQGDGRSPGRTLFVSTSAVALTAWVRGYLNMSPVLFQVHHIP